MKGLDTSVLLALLEGDRKVRDLLRRLRGVELATSEANFLELGYLAARGPAKGRRHRQETLERLRRKITVLPIDSRSVDRSLRQLRKGNSAPAPAVLAMLGAFEAAGCDEVLTRSPFPAPGRWSFAVKIV